VKKHESVPSRIQDEKREEGAITPCEELPQSTGFHGFNKLQLSGKLDRKIRGYVL
jgi:hypothetical protein